MHSMHPKLIMKVCAFNASEIEVISYYLRHLFDNLHKPRQSINITTFDTIIYTFTIITLFI